MDAHNQALEEQFASYAPASANLKQIEREIEVAEQEYLEILRGLNLAKLKLQDTQLSSNLKTLDPPYFPLNPIPTKRKFIIIAISLMAVISLLAIIFIMELFDKSIKNDERASKIFGLTSLGMLPKIFKARPGIDLVKIQDRLMDSMMQNLQRTFLSQDLNNKPKIITVFSTQNNEGKTVIVRNLAKKLKSSGYKILIFNHSDKEKTNVTRLSWLHLLFGYQNPCIDYFMF